jgi:hypothetical protein
VVTTAVMHNAGLMLAAITSLEFGICCIAFRRLGRIADRAHI